MEASDAYLSASLFAVALGGSKPPSLADSLIIDKIEESILNFSISLDFLYLYRRGYYLGRKLRNRDYW